MSTLQRALWETLLGTLPSTRFTPCIPRLPTTLIVASTVSATSRRASAGSPVSVWVVDSMPAARACAAASSTIVRTLVSACTDWCSTAASEGLETFAPRIGSNAETMCRSAPSAVAKRIASMSARVAVSEPSVPTTIASATAASSLTRAPYPTVNPAASSRLKRRRVRAAEAAVDEERRRGHVARLVAREEQRRARDLLGAREAAHRHVHEAARGLLGILRVQLFEQRRVDRTGAERVDAHAAASEIDAELARERQHAAL